MITGADWLMRPFMRWNRGVDQPRGLIRSSASHVVIKKGHDNRDLTIPAVLLMATRRVRNADATGHVVSVPTYLPEDPERDRVLMRRLLTHDEDAFAALYDHYAAQVNGVALSILRSPALAEEATHDVFLRLWQQPDSFDPARGTFAGWLLRVTRNRAIDLLRRRREDSGHGPDGDVTSFVADPAPGPEEQAIDGLHRDEVRRALNDLSADHRQLLELAYFTGLSQSQIATRLGRPLGTVKSQIRAAMGRLADRLLASGETMTSDSFTDREGRA